MPAPLSLRIKERYMAKRAGGLSQQVQAAAWLFGADLGDNRCVDRMPRQTSGSWCVNSVFSFSQIVEVSPIES
jgi:hypothetical protein